MSFDSNERLRKGYERFEERMAEAEMADAATKQELASNLTLDILQIVKVSQSQHGLRHGDHAVQAVLHASSGAYV